MKIWTPLCVFVLSACAATPRGDEPTETGGSPDDSSSGGSSSGNVNAGHKGGAGGASEVSGSSAGAGGTDEKGGKPGGHADAGGTTGAGGKSGTAGSANKANTGGSAGIGGKAGTSGSTGTGGGKGGFDGGGSAAGGKAGVGGNAGNGGSTGTGGGKTGFDGGSGSGGKTGPDGDSKGANHVFLLLGQSNMAGYPKSQESDKQKNQQIQVLGFDDCSATGRKADQWDVAVPPLHECFQGAIGAGDWFSKTIIDQYPEGDTIWLVPCALSGQAISVMSKGGSKWNWLVQRAKKGQEKGPIEGMLFHQGESDCGNSGWPAKVKQMYADLKSELGLTKDVPFLAGELPPTSQCSNHNPLVNQLPTVMGSHTYVISSQGLALDPADTQWHMHFDHDSQVTLGKRYAETMIKALGL